MDPYKLYYARAIKFLARRPRSEKEVRDNLLKKKVDGDVLEKIIVQLKEQRFLNDEEFASWWIEQRTRVTPRSMRLIKLELIQKGVDKDIIEQSLSTGYSVLSTQQSVSDVDTAKKIVEKKFSKYKGLSREEIYQKLGGLLARKGYNWDVIKSSIDDAMTKKV